VVLLHAFQMLCPGCVSHGVPQAERIHRAYARDGVAVVGLHTVFEHHAAMTPEALEAFVHEYRITHPVGVDAPITGDPIPATMQRYRLRGTPSVILIDRMGQLRMQDFGRIDDLRLGVLLGQLLGESAEASDVEPASEAQIGALPGCNETGCVALP